MRLYYQSKRTLNCCLITSQWLIQGGQGVISFLIWICFLQCIARLHKPYQQLHQNLLSLIYTSSLSSSPFSLSFIGKTNVSGRYVLMNNYFGLLQAEVAKLGSWGKSGNIIKIPQETWNISATALNFVIRFGLQMKLLKFCTRWKNPRPQIPSRWRVISNYLR